MWTQIRLLLYEQSVLGPRCLLIYLIRYSDVKQLFATTTSADDIFSCIFFLGALRVKNEGVRREISLKVICEKVKFSNCYFCNNFRLFSQ